MIVVDTNVIAYLFIPGDYTAQAKALLMKDADWIAPYLWRIEFRNILALYLRKNYFDLQTAKQIMAEAENFMRANEYEVISTAILELVKRSNCSAYDCEFVALAKGLELKLYTSDRKILNEFPELTYALSDL